LRPRRTASSPRPEEERRDDGVFRVYRQQRDESARADRDPHLDDEARDAPSTIDEGRARTHHDRRDHGLVRELEQEHQGEDARELPTFTTRS